MSDYTRIIYRLKKLGIQYTEDKKDVSKTAYAFNVSFGAVRMSFSVKTEKIVSIIVLDMRVDIENFIEKWRNGLSFKF